MENCHSHAAPRGEVPGLLQGDIVAKAVILVGCSDDPAEAAQFVHEQVGDCTDGNDLEVAIVLYPSGKGAADIVASEEDGLRAKFLCALVRCLDDDAPPQHGQACDFIA